jgi:DNA segregation ATPase FtsK/SpoIIIE-like protein
MTDNEARKRAARDFQAVNPGISYTSARRRVSRDQRRPLTAVLGTGVDGRPVRLNLEWQSRGGDGPHCVFSGPAGSGRAVLLAAAATGLFSGQNRYDVDLVVSGCDDVRLGVAHTRVDAADLSDHVDGLLEERYELLR